MNQQPPVPSGARRLLYFVACRCDREKFVAIRNRLFQRLQMYGGENQDLDAGWFMGLAGSVAAAFSAAARPLCPSEMI